MYVRNENRNIRYKWNTDLIGYESGKRVKENIVSLKLSSSLDVVNFPKAKYVNSWTADMPLFS